MSYHISEATEVDISGLAELLTVTLGQTAMYDAMFLDDPDHAIQKMMHEGRVKGLLADPKARLFKMTTEVSRQGQGQESGRLVGCIAFTASDGEVQDGPLGPGTATVAGNTLRGVSFPPQINQRAAEAVLGGVARLLDSMRGKHYADVSLLGVHPHYRSRGLASRLLTHCIDIADKDNLGTWLCALPASHGLYHRLGFTDKEYEDVNLDLVDPLNRHLGMFRHQAMYRAPPGDSSA